MEMFVQHIDGAHSSGPVQDLHLIPFSPLIPGSSGMSETVVSVAKIKKNMRKAFCFAGIFIFPISVCHNAQSLGEYDEEKSRKRQRYGVWL